MFKFRRIPRYNVKGIFCKNRIMTQVAQKNGVNSKKAEVVGEYNDWPNEAGVSVCVWVKVQWLIKL